MRHEGLVISDLMDMVVLVTAVLALSLLLWVLRRYSAGLPMSFTQRLSHVFGQPGTAFLAYHPQRQQIVESSNLEQCLGLKKPVAALEEILEELSEESSALFQHLIHKCAENVSCPPLILKTKGQMHIECTPLLAGKGPVMFVLRDISPQYRHTQMVENENDTLRVDVRRYSMLLNTTSELIWVRDKSLKILYRNLAYSRVVDEPGVAPSEAIPELYTQARRMAEKAKETNQPQRERRHIVVDGERKLYQLREMPMPDGGIIGFGRDITELEETQQEIERHMSSQSVFLESSTSAMAIFGRDMRLRSYNNAYATLWKLDDVLLDSQPTFGELLEVLREKRRLPEQANFKAFKEQRLRLFTDLLEPNEEFFYLPDGKTLRVVAIPHGEGGLMFAYEDVTDRLALERSYNTLIAVQTETLDNLHEGVIVFGENGRLRLFNPVFAHLWQVDENQLQDDIHISDVLELTRHLFRTDDWVLYKQGFIGRVQSRSLYAMRLERADGSVLNMSVVPLPDGGTLLTFTDITDSTLVERSLREKNDALQAADRLKTEFLANVSYELRSPLTSISGFSEMLRQDYFGELSERQREYVEGIHESSQHLMHLINDILDLASIEAGYMTLDVREVEIEPMLRSVLGLLNERMKRFSIHASLDCTFDIGTMRADEKRIRQVMFHLLSNAVKYSPQDGRVILGAGRDDGRIWLWVSDEGQGIEASEQAAVFDKFYRGSARSGTNSGTGLGLSMVKSFIELHGGHVELDSALGRGTTITCYLPQRIAAEPESSQELTSHDTIPLSA
ncbi:MAG: PAS-domain containing protein [Rickettsiales bacterium]|nr:PAS-domain containing protein [Rickettsiales bacterium]